MDGGDFSPPNKLKWLVYGWTLVSLWKPPKMPRTVQNQFNLSQKSISDGRKSNRRPWKL